MLDCYYQNQLDDINISSEQKLNIFKNFFDDCYNTDGELIMEIVQYLLKTITKKNKKERQGIIIDFLHFIGDKIGYDYIHSREWWSFLVTLHERTQTGKRPLPTIKPFCIKYDEYIKRKQYDKNI